MLRVVQQRSKATCDVNKSFGCANDLTGIWVSKGCRGDFDVGGGVLLECGHPGMPRRAVINCTLALAQINQTV